jgi:hypothetical protein
MVVHGLRATHELRTTRCRIQTQTVESLGSRQFREPVANGAKRCRNKFLRYFPSGFADQKYIDWERGHKWTAHQRWQEILGQEEHRALIRRGEFMEVAARAVRIESRTNLPFSFEKMALRDALKSEAGARLFTKGLYDLLYSDDDVETRFTNWCAVVAKLPRSRRAC